jgi:hypothetical protein
MALVVEQWAHVKRLKLSITEALTSSGELLPLTFCNWPSALKKSRSGSVSA